VLLIEDSQNDAHFVSLCANDHVGIDLFHAPNPLQANRFLHRNPPFDEVGIPDLVLLDLSLPLFNGFEVLQGIRETPDLAQVPVVVLTSSIHANDRKRALALGASEYLVKPMEWGRWQTTMTRLFRRYLKGFRD
jgi:DNA-binding response OmpR family regulator